MQNLCQLNISLIFVDLRKRFFIDLKKSHVSLTLAFIAFIAFGPSLFAQAPTVPIEEESKSSKKSEQQAILAQIEKLGSEGQLMKLSQIADQTSQTSSCKLALIPAKTDKLSASQIYSQVQASLYRVGWGYLCKNCDHWHTNLAGGYAVTHDGIIATCAHVIDVDEKKMREGGLIAVDPKGKVYPIQKILANHDGIDAALLKIDSETIPLSFNEQVTPGDDSFCLSRPLDQKGYFSKGMVNRFFWNSSDRGQDPFSLESLQHLKLNVSSRWAPGSSGSPVLDQFGNVIGHVATISRLKGNTAKQTSEVFITLHTATPARAIKALASKKKIKDSDP